ncbi:hypothetical protein KR032_005456, partial [Drosophila birchii]
FNLKIFNRFIGILFLSPLCWAYSDADLERDKLRVRELIRNSQSEDAKISNTQELLEIYRRVSPRYTAEERARVERLIRVHTDQILIEGVPIQGGRKSKYVKKALGSVVTEMAVGFFNELGASLWSLITGAFKTEAKQ